MHIKPGELLAVVGLVGAGKSSLVQAILGEMVKLNGDVTINVRELQTVCNITYRRVVITILSWFGLLKCMYTV